MEKPKIDLLKKKYDLGRDERSPFLFFVRPLIFVVAIGATMATIFSYAITPASHDGPDENTSLFSSLKQLVQAGDTLLKGEKDDRVNILLLGVGGTGHEGPQLSDTIMLASYQPSSKKIGLLSLPRDMSVPIPNYGYQKVNHANAYGELNGEGKGPELATSVIGNVLSQDIPYYLRVDFNGFAEFINDIGGVDIYVDQAFTDPTYPSHGKEYDTCGASETQTDPEPITDIPSDEAQISNVEQLGPDYSCRFEVLNFTQGWTHMDGETALKFVRSRHGNNGQGSDFARSRRQQQILLAVKDQLLSASTFLNPTRIRRMLDTLDRNIATNLNVWELARLANAFKNLQADQIVHHVIDASEDSPVYATTLNGSYVLLPKNDDWKPLQSITEHIWTPRDEQKTYATTQDGKPLFANVEIQNGTTLTGLAFAASQLVDGYGFEVVKIGNAASRNYEHTVIYDLTNGKRAEELKTLRDFLRADVTLSATGWMMSGDVVPKEISVSEKDFKHLATEPDIDFLVILGENASSVVRN